MISKKMEKAINEQINKEMFSAYLYLAMATKADMMVFKGTAQWFRVQAKEEWGHAMKFYKYLLVQGATVELQALAKPAVTWNSILEMYVAALKHEKFITASINGLVAQATAEKDNASMIMLQWFVTEQVEEEANATEIIAQLKLVGGSAGGVFMIDHHLGKREAK